MTNNKSRTWVRDLRRHRRRRQITELGLAVWNSLGALNARYGKSLRSSELPNVCSKRKRMRTRCVNDIKCRLTRVLLQLAFPVSADPEVIARLRHPHVLQDRVAVHAQRNRTPITVLCVARYRLDKATYKMAGYFPQTPCLRRLWGKLKGKLKTTQ